MEEDILKYSATVMFQSLEGHPVYVYYKYAGNGYQSIHKDWYMDKPLKIIE